MFTGEKELALLIRCKLLRENSAKFKSKTEIHDAFKICENKLVLNLKEKFADGLPQHDLKI